MCLHIVKKKPNCFLFTHLKKSISLFWHFQFYQILTLNTFFKMEITGTFVFNRKFTLNPFLSKWMSFFFCSCSLACLFQVHCFKWKEENQIWRHGKLSQHGNKYFFFLFRFRMVISQCPHTYKSIPSIVSKSLLNTILNSLESNSPIEMLSSKLTKWRFVF